MSEKKYLNKSMAEYVLEQNKPVGFSYLSFYEKVVNYANALSETPRLGHFIPCDENDVPLDPPIEYSGMDSDSISTVKYYQQACERVLFEGFQLVGERYIELINCDLCIDFSGKNIVLTDVLCVEAKIYTMEHFIEHELPLNDAGAKFFGL